jgi:outer membrane protein TolC
VFKYLKIYSIILGFLLSVYSPLAAEEILSWEDCLKEAAKNHPDLIAATEQTKQSQASKAISASTLFPQINASLSASTSETTSAESGNRSTADSYSYGVTGSQLIFDGLKTANDVKAASENITASKYNFKYTSVTVRFRLRSAFINLLKAQEALKITQEIYDIRRSNLELITLRYQSGLEHKGALLTAEADLANARYQIAQAKRDLEVAQRQITKEMGRKELVLVTVKGEFKVNEQVKEKPDFEQLVKVNPSLNQAIAQTKAAKYSLNSAYANFSPTLSGSAAANKSGAHWPPNGESWDLGLTLSMPIFEGGLRLAQVDQAKAYLKQLQENQRSSKDSAILALEESWASLVGALENVEVQKKQLAANQERSNIAQAQYSTGFITFDNWIIIEDNLVNAKNTYLDAQANALLAEASWVQAKGEVLENG